MSAVVPGWFTKARRTMAGRVVVAATMVLTVLGLTSQTAHAVQFCNTTLIEGTAVLGPSFPYPSSIVVSGLTGTVTDVNVTLKGITTSGDSNTPTQHWIEDADILVSAPDNSNVILMSDAGGNNDLSTGPVTNTDITFDQQAANQLPADTHITSGTYRPVDDDDDVGKEVPANDDNFESPAPIASNSTNLNDFNGKSPNGTWNLWAVDDQTQGSYNIAGGWCIDILTTGGGGTTTSTTPTPTTSTTTTLPPTTTSSTTTTLPVTTTTSSTTTTLPPTTTTSSTTTTLPGTTTTSSTTSTRPSTTTTSSTTTTLPGTTTTSSSTTTTRPTTTSTSVPPTSSTTSTTVVPGSCGGLTPTIVGTNGDDNIIGTPGNDVIAGMGGNDQITGLGGDDTICGGAGNDQISGGDGNDRLFGDDGTDRLFGGPGDDALTGGADADQCFGDTGTDTANTCESIVGIP